MLVMCPLLYRNCDGPASPPTVSVSVSPFSVLGLFSATHSCVSSALASSLLASSSICCCCCACSLSGLPLLPPPLNICRCVPKLKFRNTVSGNFYLPHSSAFLRTHCQIISSSIFVKNKILKYKVSQLSLKTALNNCKNQQTPILEMLPDVICQIQNDAL